MNTFNMEFVKKQARRLLKFSKANQNQIKISSLTEALELIAIANGYPSWHAMQKSKSVEVIENLDKVIKADLNILKFDKKNNVSLLNEDGMVYSFFKFGSNEEYYFGRSGALEKIQDKINLLWNTGFSEFNFHFNIIRSGIEKKTIEINENLTIQEKEVLNLFFETEYEVEPLSRLNMVMVVVTKESFQDEHKSLCVQLSEHYKAIHELTKNEWIDLRKNNYLPTPAIDINPNSFTDISKKLNRMYLITKMLYSKNKSLKYSVFMNSDNITNLYLDAPIDDVEFFKEYLNGVLRSLNREDHPVHTYHTNLIIDTPKQYPSYGLPIIDSKSGYVGRIGSKIKQYNIGMLIHGIYRDDVYALTSYVLMDKIYNTNTNYRCNIFLDTDDLAGEQLERFLKKVPKVNTIINVDVGKIKTLGNPFITNVGCRFPSHNQRYRLNLILNMIIAEYNPHTNSRSGQLMFLLDAIYAEYSDTKIGTAVYKQNPKKYTKGLNKKLDNYVLSQKLKPNLYWDIVDYAYINNDLSMAIEAQSEASPTFTDIMKFIENYLCLPKGEEQPCLTAEDAKSIHLALGLFLDKNSIFEGFLPTYTQDVRIFDLSNVNTKNKEIFTIILEIAVKLENLYAPEIEQEGTYPEQYKAEYDMPKSLNINICHMSVYMSNKQYEKDMAEHVLNEYRNARMRNHSVYVISNCKNANTGAVGDYSRRYQQFADFDIEQNKDKTWLDYETSSIFEFKYTDLLKNMFYSPYLNF